MRNRPLTKPGVEALEREHRDPLTVQPEPQQSLSTSSQRGMSQSIGWILQAGVIVSSAVLILGLLMLLLQGDFSPGNLMAFPLTLSQVGTQVLMLRPQAVMTLGLLLLMATPVVRVAASLLAFAWERDRRFVMITAMVLLLLCFSIFAGGEMQARTSLVSLPSVHLSLLSLAFLFVCAFLAGLLGSLVGLGGGVLIVPILTLLFGLPISFAIGASIISVIATSSGAAAAYVRDQLTNLRVGMFLELGTTIGAIVGASLAAVFAPEQLGVLFGLVLLTSVIPLLLKLGEELPQRVKNDPLARWLRLSDTYPDAYLGRTIPYQVSRTPLGLFMMGLAGIISGLLGIGSGTFKVLALDNVMRLPMKVSTTTSNFMIGVTAAASAGIYFSRGDMPPLIAAPVALGVVVGAWLGARLIKHLSNRLLRWIFIPVIVVAALEMILHSLGLGAF